MLLQLFFFNFLFTLAFSFALKQSFVYHMKILTDLQRCTPGCIALWSVFNIVCVQISLFASSSLDFFSCMTIECWCKIAALEEASVL